MKFYDSKTKTLCDIEMPDPSAQQVKDTPTAYVTVTINDKRFKDLLAKRLGYLWYLRETDKSLYLEQKLGDEKEGIYALYGSDYDFINQSRNYYYMILKSLDFMIAEGSQWWHDKETRSIKSRW